MSKYEQKLDELEQYLDRCKRQKLSGNNLIVPRDEIEEYISELRMKTPDEIRKYQKILSNREAILNAAEEDAARMMEEANRKIEEMIQEHEIMQQAYEQAQALVDDASAQAQEILDNAVDNANDIRMGAVQYTDDMLAQLQTIITHTMENVSAKYEEFMRAMDKSLEVVLANRNELAPQQEELPVEDTPLEPEMGQEDPDADYDDYTENIEDGLPQ